MDPKVVSSGISEVGNKKRSTPLKFWFLTWNNPDVDGWEQLVSLVSSKCSRATFQEEIGEKTKTPHIQGAFAFNDKVRGETLINKFKGSYWKKCISEEAHSYCCKENTRSGRVFIFPKPLKAIILKEGWQTELWETLQNEADDRTITWYWSSKGGVGKSYFLKYCIDKLKDKLAYTKNYKGADLTSTITDKTEVVIMDMPRDTELNKYMPWTAIESIKDGIICDGKLKKHMNTFRINPPWVIVFANCEPDITKFSDGRFDIRCID